MCEKPNQRTVGSHTQNVLQYVSFTALDTEEKLHWTQSRIPTCCHTVDTYCNSNSTPANSHECDDQCEWNVFVCFLCKISAFWFIVGQECYCKTITIYSHKKIHKIVFSQWNVKVSEVYNLSTLCCKLEWLYFFSLKPKRGAVIAKNVNLPPRLSCRLLYPRSSAFYCLPSCYEIHFSGPIIGPILMSDKILLICGARLKLDDKSNHFAHKRNSWNDCVDSYT